MKNQSKNLKNAEKKILFKGKLGKLLLNNIFVLFGILVGGLHSATSPAGSSSSKPDSTVSGSSRNGDETGSQSSNDLSGLLPQDVSLIEKKSPEQLLNTAKNILEELISSLYKKEEEKNTLLKKIEEIFSDVTLSLETVDGFISFSSKLNLSLKIVLNKIEKTSYEALTIRTIEKAQVKIKAIIDEAESMLDITNIVFTIDEIKKDNDPAAVASESRAKTPRSSTKPLVSITRILENLRKKLTEIKPKTSDEIESIISEIDEIQKVGKNFELKTYKFLIKDLLANIVLFLDNNKTLKTNIDSLIYKLNLFILEKSKDTKIEDEMKFFLTFLKNKLQSFEINPIIERLKNPVLKDIDSLYMTIKELYDRRNLDKFKEFILAVEERFRGKYTVSYRLDKFIENLLNEENQDQELYYLCILLIIQEIPFSDDRSFLLYYTDFVKETQSFLYKELYKES